MTDQHKAGTVAPPVTLPRSRALVVLENRRMTSGEDRPEAVFLTQLIACEQRLPAYRSARKAEPSAATVAYARQAGFSPARLNCLI